MPWRALCPNISCGCPSSHHPGFLEGPLRDCTPEAGGGPGRRTLPLANPPAVRACGGGWLTSPLASAPRRVRSIWGSWPLSGVLVIALRQGSSQCLSRRDGQETLGQVEGTLARLGWATGCSCVPHCPGGRPSVVLSPRPTAALGKNQLPALLESDQGVGAQSCCLGNLISLAASQVRVGGAQDVPKIPLPPASSGQDAA